MASIVEQMTAVSGFVDDYLKAHPKQTQWRRWNHHDPDCTDASPGSAGGATLEQSHARLRR